MYYCLRRCDVDKRQDWYRSKPHDTDLCSFHYKIGMSRKNRFLHPNNPDFYTIAKNTKIRIR